MVDLCRVKYSLGRVMKSQVESSKDKVD